MYVRAMRLAPLFYVVVSDPVEGPQLRTAVTSALHKTIDLARQGRAVALLAAGSNADSACVEALPAELQDVARAGSVASFDDVRFEPSTTDSGSADGAVVVALRPKPAELIALMEDRRVEAVIVVPSSEAELRHLQVAFPDSASV